MAKRAIPEINAGSMADIAFLLLIFFLVTTTMDVDTGISTKLPPKVEENQEPPPPIKEKNLFEVLANANDQLLVEGELMKLENLKEAAKKFIDNNGDASCTYCQGVKNPSSSDNPNKAIITLQNDRGTSYALYLSVRNELVRAYRELRDEYSQKKYGKVFSELSKSKKKEIKKLYPQKISEAEPVSKK